MTNKKAPEATGAKQRPETILPRRRWVVIRRDWRTKKAVPVATFTSPSYAGIFQRAMGKMSDVDFQIKEVIR